MSASLPPGDEFHDVVVVPYSDLLDRWRDGEIHRGGPIWPDWDQQTTARHNRAGRPVDACPPDPDGPLAEAGPMAWGGALVDAFGHQVADFSTRLLATRRARPDLPIAFASRPDLGYDSLERAPAHVRAILEWLGVPAGQVLVLTRPTLVRQLFVVPQAEQLGGPGPEEGYLDLLDARAAGRLATVMPDDLPLYISRAGMVARFAGEGYLEAALRQCGVRVVRPESMPLAEQLRAYRDATRVTMAEGSALHALQLLGHIDASVDVLERRPGTRLAEPNLRPRVAELHYSGVATGLLHGLLPSGRPALPSGLSIADEERLLAAFGRAGIDLGRAWEPERWRAARDADVLAWAEGQAAVPERLGVGSAELIIERLREAGLRHLTDDVAERLAPLRTPDTAVAAARPMTGPTLLFMHLARSGGGAVREILRQVLPAAARREVYAGTTTDAAAFAHLPEAERAAPAVVIGDFAYGFHAAVPGPARYAVMLRHPIGRILSLYRAAGRPAPSLEAWVFDDRRIAADNAMVRAISGRADVPFGACTDEMLEEAVAHIEADFVAVLLRSSMPRSAVVLGKALGMRLPPFPAVNVDPDGEDSLDPPPAVRKRLRKLNRLDLELFRRYGEGF